MMKKTLLCLAFGGLLFSAPSHAHRAWIKPDTTVLSQADTWVAFDAAVSNDIFGFDHFPLAIEGVQVLTPNGGKTTLQNTFKGKHRAGFDVHLETEGTYRVFTSSQQLTARWVDESGERQFWPPRRTTATEADFYEQVPQDAKDLTVTQVYRRTETYVTAGNPTEDNLQGQGQGFELVPITHPNDLYHGEEAEFQFTMNGEPAAGVEISIIPAGVRYRDNQEEISVTSNSEGVFSVTWPQAGLYFIEAAYQDDKGIAPATSRSGRYSAVYEVL